MQPKILLLIAALTLAACGSDEVPQETIAPRPVLKPANSAPSDPIGKMARAVTTGKSGAAVELKYEVNGKPEASKPLEIELALIPTAEIDSLNLAITASPGLTITANDTATFGTIKAGQPATHKFTVLAEHAEVVYATVTATSYAVGVTSTSTFAIPLIVGDPVVAEAAAKAATAAPAKTDASGQPVQSMQAEESK